MTWGALNTWSKVAKEGPVAATNTNCLGGPTDQQCPGLKRVGEQAKNTNTNTNIDTNTNVNTNAKEFKTSVEYWEYANGLELKVCYSAICNRTLLEPFATVCI